MSIHLGHVQSTNRSQATSINLCRFSRSLNQLRPIPMHFHGSKPNLINPKSYPSISLNPNRPKLTSMCLNLNLNQHLSASINQTESPSIWININQPQPITNNLNESQPISINISRPRPMSTNPNQSWWVSLTFNKYQRNQINPQVSRHYTYICRRFLLRSEWLSVRWKHLVRCEWLDVCL